MGKILLIISIIFSLKNIFIKNTDDDTKNLQTLLNQKNIVEFPANTTYKINGTLYLKNGQKILGNHATIIQTAPGKPIFDCVGKKIFRFLK